MHKNNYSSRYERPSMFDPYRKEIERLCDFGLTPRQVFDRLGLNDGYVYESFWQYIYVNKIREGTWTREVDIRNKCDKCEYCHEYRNVMGHIPKAYRICSKSWRVIGASVVHCPIWCELEVERYANEGKEIGV